MLRCTKHLSAELYITRIVVVIYMTHYTYFDVGSAGITQ